ncbi:prepilin-type N-terminal cleavage/methylation domain-containing protein [Cellulomonas sp. ATA003]|uniref:type IV pilus modification PilV family protein n=1 Tax=Cellulomonas sp. ATA003 TaxID=3073064 RepID=UPI002873A690|nr:prepilin-type N-terminal cleavage/methylation domain-containing protein [Cellulomonas sp. ATA003]WNB87379.1 prepilin-type N-terminal cleavage/methylation domain-containing protein [Cellulomonas sp. ATA003]
MTERRSRADAGEAGFSLVEVIVAMVLLGVIAMAFLPLVARSVAAARTGATVATASRMVADEMEAVRATATCPTDENNASPVRTVTDPRGVVLQARTDVVGECSSGLVRFTVQVARATAPTEPLATATTLVSVGGP